MMTKHERKELNKLIHQILELRDKCCLRCKTREKLQASHIYPKGVYRKLEFDVDNIKFLCWRDHWWWHKNPLEAAEWIKTIMPKERLDRLRLRSQTSGDGMRNYKMLKMYLKQELGRYN